MNRKMAIKLIIGAAACIALVGFVVDCTLYVGAHGGIDGASQAPGKGGLPYWACLIVATAIAALMFGPFLLMKFTTWEWAWRWAYKWGGNTAAFRSTSWEEMNRTRLAVRASRS